MIATAADLARLERELERIEVQVGALTVVARRLGEGSPVVLVHGGSGSWNHWVRTIRPLAERFTVVALDLPGFGESGLDPAVATLGDLVGVTSAAVDALVPSPGRFGLVGFSFGGIVAGSVAAVRGKRVSRLVLIGAGGIGLSAGVDRPLVPVDAAAPSHERAAAHRHNLAALMIADPGKVDDLAVALHDRNTAQARFRTGSIPSSTALVDVLGTIAAPVTSATGNLDAFSSGRMAQRLAIFRGARPDCDLVQIPDAGHWAAYEQPDAVNDLLADRLSSTR